MKVMLIQLSITKISSLKKREMADIVFDNNQGIEELYKQIDEFIERISHEVNY